MTTETLEQIKTLLSDAGIEVLGVWDADGYHPFVTCPPGEVYDPVLKKCVGNVGGS